MQWLIPKESVHAPKERSGCSKITEKAIANTAKNMWKDQKGKNHRERSSTMSMVITIGFSGFR